MLNDRKCIFWNTLYYGLYVDSRFVCLFVCFICSNSTPTAAFHLLCGSISVGTPTPTNNIFFIQTVDYFLLIELYGMDGYHL